MVDLGELVVESGELAWRANLRAGAQVLGRETDADLCLPLPMVSRRQLRLTCDAAGCRLENLSQTNPTYRNGQLVTSAVLLHNGDLLGIGRLRLRYRAPVNPVADAYGQLLIHQAGRADRRETLVSPQIVIGRDPNCDVTLDYPAVSRRHLRLEWQPDLGYRAIDLGSTHGTVIDGRRIDRPVLLQVNSQIWLGDALGNGVTLTYLPARGEER
jgi:pSer/pThr/pTyr-binding forkhead associated (FHA) protein